MRSKAATLSRMSLFIFPSLRHSGQNFITACEKTNEKATQLVILCDMVFTTVLVYRVLSTKLAR